MQGTGLHVTAEQQTWFNYVLAKCLVFVMVWISHVCIYYLLLWYVPSHHSCSFPAILWLWLSTVVYMLWGVGTGCWVGIWV